MRLWNSFIEKERKKPQVWLNWGIFFAVFGLLFNTWTAQLAGLIYLVVAYQAWPKETVDWEAWKLYNKLETTDREVAKPLMNNIIKHSQKGHPGGDRTNYTDCCPCSKRTEIMRKLINHNTMDDSDLEFAESYLEGRKELA